ncbi:MAG: hypothetical protein CXX81_14020 [Methanobacteriota archaeon]|nr:MAG: hypothetical protein CXX81_14020 [Euryarchaeota archaeon]
MPRLPVSQVVEHRITLGTKERQALDAWGDEQRIEGYAKAAAAIAIGGGAIAMAWAGYWTLEKVWEWSKAAKDKLDTAGDVVKGAVMVSASPMTAPFRVGRVIKHFLF